MTLRLFYRSFINGRLQPVVFRRSAFDDEWRRVVGDFFKFDDWMGSKREAVQVKSGSDIQRYDDKFIYKFDLTGFKPENIKVKTVGKNLIVEANKEERSNENGFESYSKQQFQKSVILPENVKIDDIKSMWNSGGLLKITAPFDVPESFEETEKEIAVEKENVESKTQAQVDNIETTEAHKQ